MRLWCAERSRSGQSERWNKTRRLPSASSSISQSRHCRRQSTIQRPPCLPSTSSIAVLRTVGKRHLRTDGDFRRRKANCGSFAGRPIGKISCNPRFQRDTLLRLEQFANSVRRLRAMIDNLMLTLPEHRHAALRQQLSLLDREIARHFLLSGGELALARRCGSAGTRRALRAKLHLQVDLQTCPAWGGGAGGGVGGGWVRGGGGGGM